MPEKAVNIFLRSAAGLILAASFERFACLFHGTLASRMLLAAKDPLFGFAVRDELWALALGELAIGLALLGIRDVVTRLWLLAWAISNYFVIAWALRGEGLELATTAMGRLSDPLHLHGWLGHGIGIIPYYLLIGVCLSLGWYGWRNLQEWRRYRASFQTGKDGFWKTCCPACGGHVRFSLTNEGWEIPCPHCAKPMKLRREEELKTVCFFCHGHLEFPGHALGRKIACPHCRGEITLLVKDAVGGGGATTPEVRPSAQSV